MTLSNATTATIRSARAMRAVDSLRIVAAAAAHIHDWAATTEGRRRTERVLRSLDRDAWQIVRDVRLPGGGRVDHLAVGPSGPYLLDSRSWHGLITVDHKGATITPDGRPDAAWTARGRHCCLAPAAAALGRTISAAVGSPLPAPRAVVVVWGRFPERLAVSGGITYVAGDHLAEWLIRQARRPAPVVPRPREPHPARSPA